jgi:DNA polymerase III sliding clamp (beta) subunit (PCNA family)
VIETSHVSLSFEGALSPVLILPVSEDGKKIRGEYRHIIMPLKI